MTSPARSPHCLPACWSPISLTLHCSVSRTRKRRQRGCGSSGWVSPSPRRPTELLQCAADYDGRSWPSTWDRCPRQLSAQRSALVGSSLQRSGRDRGRAGAARTAPAARAVVPVLRAVLSSLRSSGRGNLIYARRRCLTSTSRRRMGYLAAAFAAPGRWCFPLSAANRVAGLGLRRNAVVNAGSQQHRHQPDVDTVGLQSVAFFGALTPIGW